MSRNHLINSILCILAATALISCDDNDNSSTQPGNTHQTQTEEDSLILVSPAKGLMTSEDGTSATFQVSLKNAPASDVVLHLSGSPSTEATFSPDTLTFTKKNYDTPQTVTVTGVDDNGEYDGNQIFAISIQAVSADASFNDLTQTVEIVNVDNDKHPAFPHANTLLYLVPDKGLETDEYGTRAYLEFQLPNRPAYNVYVTLESTNPAEAVPERSRFVIEPDNWDQIVEIPVVGVPDDKSDGDQKFSIKIVDIQTDDPSISKEPYNFSTEEFSREVEGITYDVDGRELNNLVLSKPSGGNPFDPKRDLIYHGSVYEKGDGFLTYNVSLKAPPKNGASVYVIANVTDPTEGRVEPHAVVFNDKNWNESKEFKIYGVDDNEKDGNILFGVNFTTVSDDLVINEITTDNIVVLNVDDEETDDSKFEYALKLEADDAICHTHNDTPVSSAIYVSLNHQPTETVKVDYSVSNIDYAYIETADLKHDTFASLEFTPLNWHVRQKINIVGNQIPNLNEDKEFYIQFNTSSADKHFSGLKDARMYCTHHAAPQKDDISAITTQSLDFINFSGIDLNENILINDEVRTFYVSLSSKPTDNLSIRFTIAAETDGKNGMGKFCTTLNDDIPKEEWYEECRKHGNLAQELIFTPDDYSTPQLVRVTSNANFYSQEESFTVRIKSAGYLDYEKATAKCPETESCVFDFSNIINTRIPFKHHLAENYHLDKDDGNNYIIEDDEPVPPALVSSPNLCSSFGVLNADSRVGLKYAFSLNKQPQDNVKVQFSVPDEFKDYIKFGNSKSEYYLTFKPSNHNLSQYLNILVKDDSKDAPALIPLNYTFESTDPEFNSVPLDACKLFIQYIPVAKPDGGGSSDTDIIVPPAGNTRKLRIMAANATSGPDQMYEEPGMNMFYAMDPDIILVQEFTPSAENVVKNLKEHFHTDYSYHAGRGRIGNGIIVKGDLKILKTYSRASVCPNITDRKYEAAVIDIPGDKDLLAVSLHLYTKAYRDTTSQIDEYPAVMEFINSILNEGDYYVVVGGDLNSQNNEYVNYYWSSMLATDARYPRDQYGNYKTNAYRRKHLDWLLVDKKFEEFSVPTQIGEKSFAHGYVLDSRVHTPISEIYPVQEEDSGATNMQHMPVIRDFVISY